MGLRHACERIACINLQAVVVQNLISTMAHQKKAMPRPPPERPPWRKETQPEWIEYGVNKPPAPVFPPAPDPVHVPSSSSDGTADSSYFEQVG